MNAIKQTAVLIIPRVPIFLPVATRARVMKDTVGMGLTLVHVSTCLYTLFGDRVTTVREHLSFVSLSLHFSVLAPLARSAKESFLYAFLSGIRCPSVRPH